MPQSCAGRHQQPAPAGAIESPAPRSGHSSAARQCGYAPGKLEAGEYDAIILAAAGLNRLGKTELMKQVIPAEVMCPAAGQGALGIEVRAGDTAVLQALAFLDDSAARATTACERALLGRLGGGCQVPIGALAEMRSGRLHLQAVVARPDGSLVLRESADGDDPVRLGESVGDTLLRRGGKAILEDVYGQGIAVPAATLDFS